MKKQILHQAQEMNVETLSDEINRLIKMMEKTHYLYQMSCTEGNSGCFPTYTAFLLFNEHH